MSMKKKHVKSQTYHILCTKFSCHQEPLVSMQVAVQTSHHPKNMGEHWYVPTCFRSHG